MNPLPPILSNEKAFTKRKVFRLKYCKIANNPSEKFGIMQPTAV
jgi:hypothetical protein